MTDSDFEIVGGRKRKVHRSRKGKYVIIKKKRVYIGNDAQVSQNKNTQNVRVVIQQPTRKTAPRKSKPKTKTEKDDDKTIADVARPTAVVRPYVPAISHSAGPTYRPPMQEPKGTPPAQTIQKEPPVLRQEVDKPVEEKESRAEKANRKNIKRMVKIVESIDDDFRDVKEKLKNIQETVDNKRRIDLDYIVNELDTVDRGLQDLSIANREFMHDLTPERGTHAEESADLRFKDRVLVSNPSSRAELLRQTEFSPDLPDLEPYVPPTPQMPPPAADLPTPPPVESAEGSADLTSREEAAAAAPTEEQTAQMDAFMQRKMELENMIAEKIVEESRNVPKWMESIINMIARLFVFVNQFNNLPDDPDDQALLAKLDGLKNEYSRVGKGQKGKITRNFRNEVLLLLESRGAIFIHPNGDISLMRGIGKKTHYAGIRGPQVLGRSSNAEGLYNTEIETYMHRYPEFLGCIAHDEIESKIIPRITRRSRGGFIINTDNAGERGEHWQAVFFDARPKGSGSIEFYDSFGEKPSEQIMRDLIQINEKLDPEEYLKLKVNTIREQSANSVNCGFFCMKFLMDRFRGRPFQDTTKFVSDVAGGEKRIESFKNTLSGGAFPYIIEKDPAAYHLWTTSNQSGEGLLDWLKEGYKRLYNFFQGQRQEAGPNFKKFLEVFGNKKIKKMWAVRTPIESGVKKIMNFLSAGKIEENRARLGYDDIFHLFLRIELENGRSYRLESNPVFDVRPSPDSDLTSDKAEYKVVQMKEELTPASMMEKTIAKYGPGFWPYKADHKNCQDHVAEILQANGIYTDELKYFIQQNAEELLAGSPLLKGFSNTITDFVARLDRLISGGKKHGRAKEPVKKYRLKERGVCIDCVEPKCKCKFYIQAVLLNKKHFGKDEAMNFIENSKFKPIKPMHETENYYRFRMMKPDQEHFEYRIKKNKQTGVDFVIAEPKK